MIKGSRLGFSYFWDGESIPVFEQANIELKEGEWTAILGCNGCGKSTLLKLLNGLVFPQRGQYLFDGQEITEAGMRDHRFSKRFHQRVGFVWQNPDVQLFCTSVAEELAFGPQQLGLSEAEVRARVEDALALLSLERLRDRAPYYLSGGEKKKTAIASVLSTFTWAAVKD